MRNTDWTEWPPTVVKQYQEHSALSQSYWRVIAGNLGNAEACFEG